MSILKAFCVVDIPFLTIWSSVMSVCKRCGYGWSLTVGDICDDCIEHIDLLLDLTFPNRVKQPVVVTKCELPDIPDSELPF